MRKSIFSLLACGMLAASMLGATACGGDNGGNGGAKKKLTIWGPDAQQETLKEMAKSFIDANPDLNVTIDVGVCSEGDAYANVSKDPSAAADVYAFANDQLVNLIRVGALAEVGGSYKTKVEAENTASAVGMGKFNDKLYGYPYSTDNGYFMYYDSSVVSAKQAETLEEIVAACEGAGKKIAWEIGNGWYDVSWFFAFGCSYEVTYNDDYTEKTVTCNFNNANGIKATKAIRKLADSTSFIGAGVTVDDVKTRIGDDIAVAVTGSWNAGVIQENLGDNFAATKLPTVTVDGETKQLSSFVGGKLYGVNPHSSNLAIAHQLAQYLSGEEMQTLRFEKHQVGPSNIKVAATDAVKNDVILNAFAAQAAHGVAQTSVPSNFWDPVDAYCTWAAGTEYKEADLQTQLDAMTALIVPKAELSYCYLVGSINGWNKDETPRVDAQKFTTTDPEKKIWTLEYTFAEAGEVKAVLVDTNGNASWPDGNTPNAVIEEAGTYTLTFNTDTGATTAEKKA